MPDVRYDRTYYYESTIKKIENRKQNQSFVPNIVLLELERLIVAMFAKPSSHAKKKISKGLRLNYSISVKTILLRWCRNLVFFSQFGRQLHYHSQKIRVFLGQELMDSFFLRSEYVVTVNSQIFQKQPELHSTQHWSEIIALTVSTRTSWSCTEDDVW